MYDFFMSLDYDVDLNPIQFWFDFFFKIVQCTFCIKQEENDTGEDPTRPKLQKA
jgi:hypothetical protein